MPEQMYYSRPCRIFATIGRTYVKRSNKEIGRFTIYGKENILFNLSEESDGTVRILDLLEVLLAGEGKTYVIDELDRCLHPSLTYKFVDTFLQLAAQKNIQLIVTTHESRLLDFDLLRRDEIWFVNKRKTGIQVKFSRVCLFFFYPFR